MNEVRVLLAGMPETGKTSYTAALWNLVESGGAEAAFEAERLGKDREYLNTIRRTWLRVDEPERTLVSSGVPVVMHLRARDSGRSLDVLLPDRSGEVFKAILADREWSVELDEFLAELAGVLVFVHPDHVNEPVTIEESLSTELALGGDQHLSANTLNDSQMAEPWSPKMVPTQVQLVDLLQLLLDRTSSRRPQRVGVMISAWDVLGDSPPSPDLWLRRRLPLLDQFLRASSQDVIFHTYGISAYGGDPVQAAEDLRSYVQPADRPIIVGPNASRHDMSAPLRWLLDR